LLLPLLLLLICAFSYPFRLTAGKHGLPPRTGHHLNIFVPLHFGHVGRRAGSKDRIEVLGLDVPNEGERGDGGGCIDGREGNEKDGRGQHDCIEVWGKEHARREDEMTGPYEKLDDARAFPNLLGRL
jgi:hypothetical protein